VSDPGAPKPCRLQCAQAKPQRLVHSLTSAKTHESTAAVNTGCHSVHPEEHEDPNCVLVAHCLMTQHFVKAGMKHFKERGEKAASAKLHQLHCRHTFEPLNPADLTREELQEVLESHAFLKEKRDQAVKGRAITGGNKQRGKIDKLEAPSPTAASESALLAAVIDAHEGRDVTVVGTPNAFVQTRLEDNKDKAVMRLRVKLAKLVVKVAPEIHIKCVMINKKGETVLRIRLLSALCGIMKAALLCHQRFVIGMILVLPTKWSKANN